MAAITCDTSGYKCIHGEIAGDRCRCYLALMDIDTFQVRAILPLIALLPSVAVADYEEPSYEVVGSTDAYELRRYDGYVVAETTVTGNFDDAGNVAFRRLAGYIFGDNSDGAEMNMTAPVESRPADVGVEMAMTVPVTSVEAAADSYVYAFVMERRYTIETLPRPNDARITLREVPARTMAVRRFSGFWSERNYQKNEAILLSALTTDNVRIVGEPLFARYNGPLTPWFLRRNEVMIEVDPTGP